MSGERVQLDLIDWLEAQALGPAPVDPSLQAEHPAANIGPVLLTRVDPSRNMRRFYSAALATSLFGEVGVVRQWGRIGSQGQSRTDWYEGSGSAEAARLKLLSQKQRRGYMPTSQSWPTTSKGST